MTTTSTTFSDQPSTEAAGGAAVSGSPQLALPISGYAERCQPYQVLMTCGHIETRMMREATAGVPWEGHEPIKAGAPCAACWDYEQKLAAKRQNLTAAADNAANEAAGRFSAADRLADVMNGQPILIGHHSERHHRRDIARMDNNMHKGIEATKRAEDFRRRAASLGTGGISADDPAAVLKLQAKLDELQAERDRMTTINKLFRKQDAAGLAALGLDIDKLKVQVAGQYSWERAPFAPYQLQNIGARIRSTQKRIEELRAEHDQRSEQPAADRQIGDWTVSEHADDNRIWLTSPRKPAESVRQALKRHGFKWSPTRGAWVRQLTDAARLAVKQLEATVAGSAT